MADIGLYSDTLNEAKNASYMNRGRFGFQATQALDPTKLTLQSEPNNSTIAY